MKNNNLVLENNISISDLRKSLSKKFLKKIKKIEIDNLNLSNNKNSVYNTLSKNYKFNFKFQDLQNFRKFKNIAIIGMGGSVLGSMAIYKFLKNKIKKNLFFFDNIDHENVLNFNSKIKNSSTLFLVISKSGNTIETIANFLSLNKIKKNQRNIILISEKKNNILFKVANKFNLFYIEHKSSIGGRYSVLSEVGVVPAYLMGLNILKLRKNVRRYFFNKEKKYLRDSCVKIANLIEQKKFKSLVFLNYSPKLEYFLYWCQQLIAESLGKKKRGLLPIISNVPKDHHSLLQLYLDGPKDKLFHIFSVDEISKNKIKTRKLTNNLDYLHNLDLLTIKNAQKKALIKTFKKKKIAFREFRIKKNNEETLGELFAYFILETSIIGKILEINPFDQPAVEQVKKTTKNILS